MSILSGFEKQYEYTAVGNDHKKVSKWTSTDTIDLGTYTNKDKTKANSNWDSGYDNTNAQPTKMSDFVGKITAFFNNVKYLKKVHDALETTVNALTTSVNGAVKTIKMNGASKTPTSGVVDLGTVITSHQSLANYATLTGTQTITGTKTFTQPPKLTERIDTQLSNDANILSKDAIATMDNVVLSQSAAAYPQGYSHKITVHGAYGYVTTSRTELFITMPLNVDRRVTSVTVTACTIQLRGLGKNNGELVAGYIGGDGFNLFNSGITRKIEIFPEQGCMRIVAKDPNGWVIGNSGGGGSGEYLGDVINNSPFNGQVNVTLIFG